MSIDHIDLEKLSHDELVQLNRRIIRRLQYLHSLKTQAVMDKFQVGDRVSFKSNSRQIEGIVVRINRKTLSVHTDDANWNIHPGMVNKITDQHPTLERILGQGLSQKDKSHEN